MMTVYLERFIFVTHLQMALYASSDLLLVVDIKVVLYA